MQHQLCTSTPYPHMYMGSKYRVHVASPSQLVRPDVHVGVLWPNGWMDQDETWHADRPRPWPHCIRWEPSSPSPKGSQTPNFRPMSVVTKGWMDQDATWYESRPRPRPQCYMSIQLPLPKERGHSPPNIRLMSIVATGQAIAHLSYC